MKKTIVIDNKEVTFEANAAIFYVYKNQFGNDILTILMPVISEVLRNSDELFKRNIKNIFKKSGEDKINIDILPSDFGDLLESVYSIEMVDLQNIIWTMAKMADEDIKEPARWYAEFEEFPIFETAKELVEILLPSLISKKKLKKLREIKKTIATMST